MASNYKIGTSLVGITSLDLLATPVVDPKHTFVSYSRLDQLGNGMVRGGGWMKAEWRYGFVTQAQRDMLRTFCTGASSEVFIRTRKNDTVGAFVTYKAVMIWPDEEETDAGRRMDFIIKFQRLEVQT